MGHHTEDVAYRRARSRLRARPNPVCAICGEQIDKRVKWPDPKSLTIDHVIPVSRGGSVAAPSNLRIAHAGCNRKKSDKIAGPRRSAPGQHAVAW